MLSGMHQINVQIDFHSLIFFVLEKSLTAVSSLGTAVVLAAAAEDIIRRLIDLCPLSMK